jgi:hypothetical protein
MLDPALHVANPSAGIALVPGAVEVLGRRPELYDEVAGQVLRFGLTPFLMPEADQSGFIVTHYDPGIGTADERAALRPSRTDAFRHDNLLEWFH